LTGDTGGGTIDESTVVVNNVNNDSQFTGIGAVVNKNDTTNLDLTLESTLLINKLMLIHSFSTIPPVSG
jgi:hypothetical protein